MHYARSIHFFVGADVAGIYRTFVQHLLCAGQLIHVSMRVNIRDNIFHPHPLISLPMKSRIQIPTQSLAGRALRAPNSLHPVPAWPERIHPTISSLVIQPVFTRYSV